MPRLIVLHYTAMQSAAAAIERLCDPQAEVSAHYVIARDGTVTQLVQEQDRAWHAGAGEWCGQDDINSRSIGIELDNGGDHPFSEPLMCSLEALLPQIMSRWSVPPSGVIGHSDLAPGRKHDPGKRFDWGRLARRKLAGPVVSTIPRDLSEDAFRQAAQAVGYTADVPFETLLSAVRLRTRPWQRGPLCAADFAFPGSEHID